MNVESYRRRTAIERKQVGAGRPASHATNNSRACFAILAEPEVVARLAAMSNEPTPGTPEQAASFIAAEVARWSDVVKAGNIRMP